MNWNPPIRSEKSISGCFLLIWGTMAGNDLDFGSSSSLLSRSLRRFDVDPVRDVAVLEINERPWWGSPHSDEVGLTARM